MSTRLVIPVRSLQDGKHRLASELDSRRREALVEWLLSRTLEKASIFPGLSQTMIVTACRRTASYCVDRGATALRQSVHAGLNGALSEALAAVAATSSNRMLVIAADLPTVSENDLQTLAAAGSRYTIAVAPDRHGSGTNGLCVPTDRPFEFSFGADSFARHLSHISSMDMDGAVVQTCGLALDIDVYTDIECLLADSLLLPSERSFFSRLTER